jgi:phosphate transport system protein
MTSDEPPAGSPTPSPGTHHHAQKDLEALWQEILDLAETVEAALAKSVRGLRRDAVELAAEVKAEERRIDRWEVRIEQACLRALARYGPVASDLRRVAVVLKINGDLERIADLAEHIATRARKLARAGDATPAPPVLEELGDAALAQVRDALRALCDVDSARARNVIANDRVVDRRLRAALRELKEAIRRDPERLETLLSQINTARNLERAADHAANIAKAIVFLKEGDIIRHAPEGATPLRPAETEDTV